MTTQYSEGPTEGGKWRVGVRVGADASLVTSSTSRLTALKEMGGRLTDLIDGLTVRRNDVTVRIDRAEAKTREDVATNPLT